MIECSVGHEAGQRQGRQVADGNLVRLFKVNADGTLRVTAGALKLPVNAIDVIVLWPDRFLMDHIGDTLLRWDKPGQLGPDLATTWKNIDPLLGHYSGAAGIKTGYTAAAGQCLLFEARRGNRTLIGVVLDSSAANSATLAAAGADATAMLNWGFGLRTIRADDVAAV